MAERRQWSHVGSGKMRALIQRCGRAAGAGAIRGECRGPSQSTGGTGARNAVTQHRTPRRFLPPCDTVRERAPRENPSRSESPRSLNSSGARRHGRFSGQTQGTPQPAHPLPSSSLPHARGSTARWTEPGSRLSRKAECLKTQRTPPSHTCFPITHLLPSSSQ